MRIDQLRLIHFRGISDLTLDFPERTTVLVGVNGAGKSSILDALRFLLMRFSEHLHAVLLAKDDPRLLRQRAQAASVPSLSDIQVGRLNLQLEVLASIEGRTLNWSIASQPAPLGGFEVLASLQGTLPFFEAHSAQAWKNPQLSIPLFAYYFGGYYSAEEEDPKYTEEAIQNQFSAYEHALDGTAIASAVPFVKWFRQREDYENEKRTENSLFRDAQLEAVRGAVRELLPGLDNLRIRRQPARMLIQKRGAELELKHLSAGERYLLALGGDIARRLALANPAAQEPRLCNGVILIDEIETHLHPGWQRKIIPALERTFPNCQFIVATHSPQVLSEVRPVSIYLLDQEQGELKVTRPSLSYGRDTNRILEEVMGVPERPDEIRQKLGEYFRLIAMGKQENARALRQELEKEIGPDEPEFARADVLIRAQELLSDETHHQGS